MAEPRRDILPSAGFTLDEQLPDPLPADPFPTIKAWLDHAFAERVQPNPNAMTLATIDADGRPSARVVLLKGMDAERGYVVFYSNRNSRKGRALAANPRAAIVLHWDALGRQVRIEGPVVRSPDEESDAYFNSRPAASRIGAWASDQSAPIESRDDLLEKVAEQMARLGVDFDNADSPDLEIPRPPHWGGYRLWADAVELWVADPARVHDRARWERTLTPSGGGFEASAWTATRLQP